MRNGYCPTTIKTTAGPVTVQRPKRRGTTERFASQLFGTGVTKTNALEALVIAGFVRGLSTRDIEATLVDALGDASPETTAGYVHLSAATLAAEYAAARARIEFLC